MRTLKPYVGSATRRAVYQSNTFLEFVRNLRPPTCASVSLSPTAAMGGTVSGHLHASRYLCRQALIGEIARMTAKSGISGEADTAVTHRAPRRRQESTAAHCHSERPIGAETAKVRSRRRGRGVWLSQLLQIASGSIELDFVSCARTAERLCSPRLWPQRHVRNS